MLQPRTGDRAPKGRSGAAQGSALVVPQRIQFPDQHHAPRPRRQGPIRTSGRPHRHRRGPHGHRGGSRRAGPILRGGLGVPPARPQFDCVAHRGAEHLLSPPGPSTARSWQARISQCTGRAPRASANLAATSPPLAAMPTQCVAGVGCSNRPLWGLWFGARAARSRTAVQRRRTSGSSCGRNLTSLLLLS